MKNNGNNKAASGSLRPFEESFLAMGEDVWTVIVTICAPLSGAMVAGEKVAVAPAGRVLTAKATTPGYELAVGARENL
jgi:hypothetical protein